ncbi:30S ribosomal protein S4 [Sphaerochaeta halotolerans]|jgi:small subunit ribosomal protein S4|uniref:Small ribosomal subunit protein uS4 n=1 Tax=Sphaerochaeta halotolerans TaxID=2293840 RepID=A0A372MFX9_9SPIR|nr:30S ribosomal protein S4 [Sphaerochaeta halotolerans]RFU94644.1 30S ribosomal protein S4 [Sphaerochaeta halotolerans]
MAISRTPVFKRCDYLGINPLVLGYSHKPSIRRTKTTRRRKQSVYARQLIEKQKLRFIYGVLEKQFKLIYARAEKIGGITGENLLTLLELRFDNVIFRLGLSTTRREGRQLINHGHLMLNGRRVGIPSVTLKVGDVISVHEKSKQALRSHNLAQNRKIPAWLEFDEEKLEGKVVTLPKRSDIDYDVTESAVVELYSK